MAILHFLELVGPFTTLSSSSSLLLSFYYSRTSNTLSLGDLMALFSDGFFEDILSGLTHVFTGFHAFHYNCLPSIGKP